MASVLEPYRGRDFSGFDFDLSNVEWREWLVKRGQGHLWGETGSQRHDMTQDPHVTREAFCEAFGVSIGGYIFTDSEMDTHWGIMVMSKCLLQKFWDEYWDW